jgi:hypothetical protein
MQWQRGMLYFERRKEVEAVPKNLSGHFKFPLKLEVDLLTDY